MTDNLQDDVIQMVVARETVRAQAEILKAMGLPPFYIASEMMTQGVLMVIPLDVDQARAMVQEFWTAFLADYKAKTASAAGASLGGGVLPLARPPVPANDDAGRGGPSSEKGN